MLGCAVLFHVPGSRPFVHLCSSFSCIPQQGTRVSTCPLCRLRPIMRVSKWKSLSEWYDTLRCGFLDALLRTRPTGWRFIRYLCCDVQAITCYFAAIPCRRKLCSARSRLSFRHFPCSFSCSSGLSPPRRVWTSSSMTCRMFSSGTGFRTDTNYGLYGVSGGRSPDRDRHHRGRVEEPCDGAVRGASPGRTAAGTQFQSPTQIDRVVGGWACARVLRFGAAPVGRSYPMIRRAGGVCKADAQELSDDRRA